MFFRSCNMRFSFSLPPSLKPSFQLKFMQSLLYLERPRVSTRSFSINIDLQLEMLQNVDEAKKGLKLKLATSNLSKQNASATITCNSALRGKVHFYLPRSTVRFLSAAKYQRFIKTLSFNNTFHLFNMPLKITLNINILSTKKGCFINKIVKKENV